MRRDARARRWLVVACVLASAGLASCIPDAPPGIRLNADVVVPDGAGVVFWIDGLGWDDFQRLQRAGKLPNITRYLCRRGVTVEAAVTSFPTITYANAVSYVTGQLPGHHGIIDNKWFDHCGLVLQNYTHIRTYQRVDRDYVGKTIYEALSDEYTASILTPVRRGATRPIDNWATAGVAWLLGFQDTVDHLTTLRFELISDLANRTGRWPRFVLAYYSAPDTVAHRHSASSPEYEQILLDADRQVGHVCLALARAGLLDKLTLALVSDHGMVNTPRHLDVEDYFEYTLGLSTTSAHYGYEKPYEDRLRHFAGIRAVVNTGGDRHCAIQLRIDDRWWRRPSEEEIDGFVRRFGRGPAGGGHAGAPTTLPAATLPEMLAALPCTELVMVRRGDDSVRVHNARGAGVIERLRADGGKRYRYAVQRGSDPLGYDAAGGTRALMDGRFHDADAWLQASLDANKPDCVMQLIEMNDSPRSGDIVLFANEGWDFGRRNAGGHGGLARREITVPMIWAGPGLPAGASVAGGRTVDLMPTMLQLIGRAERIPGGIDGRSMADRLKSAAPTSRPANPG